GVAVVAITGAAYFWGIPALAALVAPRVPIAWEERLGHVVFAQLAPPDAVCEDPVRRRALDAIVGRLAATVPQSPYAFHVAVADRPEVNALAAPGGSIVLMRGLVELT